jgi:hypothetical protein
MRQENFSFLKAAEQCLRLAAKEVDPVERRELLHIADGWLKLAQERAMARRRNLQ